MVRLRPDWRAYFLNFCTRHGGDPVEIDGRLVFRDGWAYARADYRGPEFAPPQRFDDLVRLQVQYWTIRRRVLVAKRDAIMYDMESLATAQRHRNAPIPVKGTTVGEDREGRQVLVSTALDVRWEDLKAQLAIAVRDVDEATNQLRELEGMEPVELPDLVQYE